MEGNMSRKLLLSLCVLLSAFYCRAADLSIPMAGNGNGKYLNGVVQILGDATYDAGSVSVMSTGGSTAIKVNSVNLGDAIYTYNAFSIEYTNPQELTGSAFFDVYLEDSAEPITSVPVEKTMAGEYKTATANLSQSVQGKHNIFIRWRGHNSALKTFMVNELKPLASVSLVRSFNANTFKFSKADLGNIEGVHRLKMLWRNQNAVVRAVYLDRINPLTSVNELRDEQLRIVPLDKGFRIISDSPIGTIELYSSSGMKIKSLKSGNCIEEVFAEPGTYVLKIANPDGKVVVRKLLL